MTDRPQTFSDYEDFQLETFVLLEKAVNYNNFIVSLFSNAIKGKTVLEIGCGNGVITKYLADYAQMVYGNDISTEALRLFEQRFESNQAVKSFRGDLLSSPAFPHKVDCVVMINVLEHIRDDRGAIVNLGNYVTPDGRLILFVPAFETLYSDLDRLFLHQRRYNKRTLARLLEKEGFQIEQLRYVNFIGFWGWLINHKIFGKKKFDAKQVEFFDRFIVPLEKRLARWPLPLGQSLLCVARFPGLTVR